MSISSATRDRAPLSSIEPLEITGDEPVGLLAVVSHQRGFVLYGQGNLTWNGNIESLILLLPQPSIQPSPGLQQDLHLQEPGLCPKSACTIERFNASETLSNLG
jgi:hypothetical protein